MRVINKDQLDQFVKNNLKFDLNKQNHILMAYTFFPVIPKWNVFMRSEEDYTEYYEREVEKRSTQTIYYLTCQG